MSENNILNEIKNRVEYNRNMIEAAEEFLPDNGKSEEQKALDENKKIRRRNSISLESEVVHHQEEDTHFRSNM